MTQRHRAARQAHGPEQRRRVVITGSGVVTALGSDSDTLWRNLVGGRSGIRLIQSFDTTDQAVKIAGEVDFDPNPYIDVKAAKRLDRFSQFALVASMGAVKDAGLDFATEDKTRCGVTVGSGIGGISTIETEHRRLLSRGARRVSPLMIPKLMINAACGQISIHYGLLGPNSASASACASAAHAIGDAFHIVARGEADLMLTGGSEAAVTPLAIAGFAAQRALSTNNSEPERACRPFDKDRDGFVMAEGAGILVLEEYEHAKARGANILAEFLGFGASADSHNIVAPHPDGTGAALSMQVALSAALINPEEINYINAHGTGTPLGDEAETSAIKKAFGDYAPKVPISSTKSMLGHLLGASGAVELVATVQAVRHDVIHPTINLETPDPRCDLDYVPGQARETKVNYALCNSFGFGGHNATMLIGKLLD